MLRKVWLIKMEEDLPIDVDPYPHRMSVIADVLCKEFCVTRFASQLNHKRNKARNSTGKVSIKKNYELHLIKSFFRYENSKYLRFFHIYFSAIQLLTAFIRTKEKPDLIICAMPSPANCFVSAVYKKLFSKRTKLILDTRDLWPEILSDELNHSLVAKYLTCVMNIELKYAVKNSDGFLGVSDYFSSYLNRYAESDLPAQTFYLLPGSSLEDKLNTDQYIFNFPLRDKLIFVFGGKISKTSYTELSRFMRLFPNSEDFVLVICGNGYYYKQLRAQATQENIHILGYVDYAKFKYIKGLSSYGLICVSNRNDYKNSLSNKFFDYLFSGLPIITNVDGLLSRTIVNNNIGFVYQSDDDLKSLLRSDEISTTTALSALKSNVQKCGETVFCEKVNNENLTSFVHKILQST